MTKNKSKILPNEIIKDQYDPKKIEKKWQKEWQKKKIYKTASKPKNKKSSKQPDKPKFYVLDMFPYPSGEGLHVGHPKGYIATDVFSRMKRMQGFNVLHPMGFDAFGLPAENYAIQTKTNPATSVTKNVKHYKNQLEILGFDYDWSREINTTDPKYYKWTQWIFLKLLEKGLAYESFAPINWCPVDKTGLANEDVEDGRCERCGSAVEKKMMRQWVLKITDYADRLIDELDLKDEKGKLCLNWPESIKEAQRNWIGRSKGALITFKLDAKEQEFGLEVFTTRPDTLFGVTYIVISPGHTEVQKLLKLIKNEKEVKEYVEKSQKISDIDKSKEKTGIVLEGILAINPVNQEKVPVWIADYVLADYGTGAIMAVPAHDDRDLQFAEKYNLPVKKVIDEKGILISSGEFGGLEVEDAKNKIVVKVGGRWVKKYKLQDWVFSRQRYWGEPIPVLHSEKEITPVSEKNLPLRLPKVKYYEPTDTGESPLANISKWVNVTVGKGKNKKAYKRETNTMPQWAGSSWYYLRYMDPKNSKKLVDPEEEKYWNAVDLYVGGAEHATRHLIYARFWHKFLYDIGVVSTKEPFKRLHSVGLILAEDGRKMSKRWKNVVNPDDIVERFGADTLRLYEMFMGPFEQAIAWNTDSMVGSRRFIERVWKLGQKVETSKKDNKTIKNASRELDTLFNRTIKKVGEDIDNFRFNTAVSSLMIFLNEFEKQEEIEKNKYETFLQLLAPFAPHVTEELWKRLGNKISIHLNAWPVYNETSIENEQIDLVIQINGKTRGTLSINREDDQKEIEMRVKEHPDFKKYHEGRKIKKVIYVKARIISLLVDEY